MKFTNILALCALVSSADAFTAQAPRSFGTALNADKSSYSYLGNMNGDDKTATRTTGAPSVASVAGSTSLGSMTKFDKPKATKEIFDELVPVTVQGGSLRTCSFDETVERVTIFLKTDGRPLNANVELWQGPDNTPQKVQVYLEDGLERPFSAVIESPGGSNAIAIRNTGMQEFPLIAHIQTDTEDVSPAAIVATAPRTIQGGAVYTTPFDPSVASVQVLLQTDGRPLNAKIELLQGPNNNKQVMEVYTEDGMSRPFYVVIETPGTGNVVRLVNTATIEYPITAVVEPYSIEEGSADGLQWSD